MGEVLDAVIGDAGILALPGPVEIRLRGDDFDRPHALIDDLFAKRLRDGDEEVVLNGVEVEPLVVGP